MAKDTNTVNPSNKKSFGGRIIKFLIFFFFISGLLMAFALVKANNYLQSNQTKILDNLEFLNKGQLSFTTASISIFKNFPAGTITINQLTVEDSLFEQHQLPFLKIGELNIAVSLQKLLQKSIEVKSVHLQDGTINLYKDSSGYSNLAHLFKQEIAKEPEKGAAKVHLQTNHLKVALSNMEVQVIDLAKNQHLSGQVEHLFTVLNLEEKTLTAPLEIVVAVKELAFKKQNGAFLENSKVRAKIPLSVSNGILSFEPFDLQINEEHFTASGQYDTKKTSRSTFFIENKTTRLHQVLPLLTKKIQQTLLPYQVANPFYSKTKISGTFSEGENLLIDIQFKMVDNDLVIQNKKLNNTTLDGRFVNRIYDDERALLEGKKRIRVEATNLTTSIGVFNLQTDDLLITATPKQKPKISLTTKINGKAIGISDWLKNDQFFFQNGTFDLSAKVKGPLNDFNQLVVETDAILKLKDFSVAYKPANVTFPFQSLALSKEAGDAYFTIINSTFLEGYQIAIDGGLKNLPPLLLNLANQQTSSEVNIVTNKLTWSNFVDLFGENGYIEKGTPKTDREKKQSMKTTISGIQNNFQPRLSISVDTLQYFDLLQLKDFRTGIHFKEEHTLILEKTSFKYEEGSVNFKGQLDISKLHQTPFEFELHANQVNLQKLLPPFNYFNIALLANFEKLPENLSLSVRYKGILDDEKGLLPNTSSGEIVFKVDGGKTLLGKITYGPDKSDTTEHIEGKTYINTKIELEGNPFVFNTFFKTERFFFGKGKFFAKFDYNGALSTVEQILNQGNATLSLQNSKVYYKPTGVQFPLTQIDIALKEDNASFDFLLKTDSLKEELHFVGEMEHISELIVGNTGKSLTTTVGVNASKLTWQHFLLLFLSDATEEEEEQSEPFKTTLKDLLSTFNPKLHLTVDTFLYNKNLMVEDINTRISLKDSTTLVFENTGFDFHKGSMIMDAQFDLSKFRITPFKTHIETEQLNLAKLLKSLNYLQLPALQSVDKLTGKITMDFHLKGIIADKGLGLIPKATEGILDFSLGNVQIMGMAPLDSIAKKIRMEKRFDFIRFRPIKNKITIKGQEIEIPLMEIQSNAFQMFVEGTLSYGDKTNIWISIPLKNLKKRDWSILPKKKGYAATRIKAYIKVTSDENGENNFKFHLFKRKFYKERGILKQYRADKRKYRKIRRAKKRNK